MTRSAAGKQSDKISGQILGMIFIGAGLLVFGVLAFFLLPKPPAGMRPGETGNNPSAVPVSVGFPAPALALEDIQGRAAALADLHGQIVLVNNWATWCPPCKAEMPVLQDFYEEHREEGFTIVAIEAGEPAAEVADFVQAYGLTFPVWVDPGQKALDAFRNLSLPSSYVLDRRGQVRLAWTGAISREMLEVYVTPLLEE